MSEHPNVILGALLTGFAAFAGILAAGLAGLGGSGLVSLTAVVIGAFSACIYFLTALGQVPLTSLAIVALAFVSLLAFARAMLSYWRQRRLLASLPVAPLEGELAEIARAAGAPVYRTPANCPAAFCVGLIHPRVIVSDGLLERLDPEEQAAAIWHEAQHARVREPLKCLLARLAAVTFFWMPLLADLLKRYLLVKELHADRLAVGNTSRRALAGALCEVLGEAAPAGAVGLADFADARVDRLFDPGSPLPPLSRPLRLLASAIGPILVALPLAFPAKLEVRESQHLHWMLTSISVHGAPGMAIGFVVNALVLACLALVARRLVPRW